MKSMSGGRVLPLLLAVVVACDDSPATPSGEPEVSESALFRHVSSLASDAMRGRRAGSADERLAAAYIEERFRSLGLEPGTDDYLQEFTIDRSVDGQLGLPSQNVLAALPGEGELAGQWVVLGAHYDHLGVRATADGPAVFNGADDNASGTALLLETARVLSLMARDGLAGERGRRSIMFQAYGAEEVGLVGSFYFCEHPTVSMDSVVAMLNFDMVGRLRENGLILIGSSSSSDWPRLVAVANGGGLRITANDGLIDRSDQYCFFQSARPVLFLHTGLHSEYHTPDDDVALIDERGMARIGELAVALAVELAVRPEPPTFTGSSPVD